MPLKIVNSGTPLSGAPARPLWTDLAGTAGSPTPTAAPPFEVRLLSGQVNSGVTALDFALANPFAINSVQVDFKVQGKLNDQISITLQHANGFPDLVLTSGHQLQGGLISPNPYQPQTTILPGLGAPPPGARYLGDVGVPTAVDITRYEGENAPPNSTLKNVIQPGPSQTVTTDVFSPPFGVEQGFYSGYNIANLTYGAVIFVQNKKYTLLSQDQIKTFPNSYTQNAFDNTGSWNAFQAAYQTAYNYYNGAYYYGNVGFFKAFGAHGFQVKSVDYQHVQVGPLSGTQVVYNLLFYVFGAQTWLVEELPQYVYEVRVPAQRQYEIPTQQGLEYNQYAARTDTLSFNSSAWRNLPAEGMMTLLVNATPAPLEPFPTSPLVNPEPLKLTNVQVTIYYLPNSQFTLTGLSTTTPRAGVVRAQATGNLRSGTPPEDRALFAIFCQIGGNIGILCGISLLRKDRSKQLFDYNYFISTTCELDNFSQYFERQSIKFKAQDWGDPSFSAKGNEGLPGLLDATGYRRYPIIGPVGARVDVCGNRLTFQLLGNYPALVYDDPTVGMITSFSKYSLNS